MHYDFRLIAESKDLPDLLQAPAADVLLIGGSKSPAYFAAALDALESAYPGARRIELPGLDHGGSTDRDGKPELLAPRLLEFFAGRS
jgi:pimeloyl-ACP methyl ester carboxylesterase